MRRCRFIKNQIAVNLIRNQNQIMTLTKIRESLDFSAREYSAQRILRIA